MKMIQSVSFMVFFLSLATASVGYAESDKLNSRALDRCGGSGSKIELRESDNGDLHVNLIGNRCSTLRIYDRSNGRNIKTYDIKGSNFTLSNKMLMELGKDCEIGVDLTGPLGGDHYKIVHNGCLAARASHAAPAPSPYSFQLSKNGNCKLMVHGAYANKLVPQSFCQGAVGKDIVSYEASHNGNCKLMINGVYANRNVGDYYCSAKKFSELKNGEDHPVDTATAEESHEFKAAELPVKAPDAVEMNGTL